LLIGSKTVAGAYYFRIILNGKGKLMISRITSILFFVSTGSAAAEPVGD